MSKTQAKRCPFCHKLVRQNAYDEHIEGHTRLRDDGQMTDHITLPPEERAAGALDGVPRVYQHERCGESTGMPEEIIRSYLKNPWLYSNFTFCCGCGDYFDEKEFFWTETGENLAAYKARLKSRAKKRGKRSRKPQGKLMLYILLACVVLGLFVLIAFW